MDHVFRVGETYRDRAGASFENDEFLRWFHHEKTIGNAGGVRWRDFLELEIVDQETAANIPAYFVFVTVRKRSQFQNPWEDVIGTGQIRYWGDAKIDSTKRGYAEFRGNRRISAASRADLHGNDAIPPILHFTKFEEGWVHFTGLCWMSSAEVEHFADDNDKVENLVTTLRVLDVPQVSTKWLKERSAAKKLTDCNVNAPSEWIAACQGFVDSAPHPVRPYTLAIAERAVREVGWSDQKFDPQNLQDGRARIMIQIYERQGQADFRRRLLDQYRASCAITGCTIIEILEACHISPYRGSHTNDPRNGLLLRADIHALFDQGLIGVDARTMTVALSDGLRGSEYEYLQGQQIRAPLQHELGPNVEALRQHYGQMNIASKDAMQLPQRKE